MYVNESHVNELIGWLDSGVLARNILEQMQELGVEPTVENAKKVWLDFLLTEFVDGLRNSIDALVGKGEIKVTE